MLAYSTQSFHEDCQFPAVQQGPQLLHRMSRKGFGVSDVFSEHVPQLWFPQRNTTNLGSGVSVCHLGTGYLF